MLVFKLFGSELTFQVLELRALFYVGAFDRKLREVALKVELDNECAPGGGLAEDLQVPACNVAPCSDGVLIFWH